MKSYSSFGPRRSKWVSWTHRNFSFPQRKKIPGYFLGWVPSEEKAKVEREIIVFLKFFTFLYNNSISVGMLCQLKHSLTPC